MDNSTEMLNNNDTFSYITFLLRKRVSKVHQILRYRELKKIMQKN